MDRLYTPWRMTYIQGKESPLKGCLFCVRGEESPSEDNLVLNVSKDFLILLNLYPYNNGHLLVAPRKHVPSLQSLSGSETAALTRALVTCETILQKAYNPDGLNIGMNVGRSGGAGIPDHVHWHVVPRWNGDSNFMTTVGATRLQPQRPCDAWRNLIPYALEADWT